MHQRQAGASILGGSWGRCFCGSLCQVCEEKMCVSAENRGLQSAAHHCVSG